ncbi:MAG: class B sortase [Wujia sp.]
MEEKTKAQSSVGDNEKETKKTIESKKTKKSKKKLYIILLSVFGLGIVICLTILAVGFVNQKRAEKTYKELQDMATEYVNNQGSDNQNLASDTLQQEEKEYLTNVGVEIPEKSLNWDELKKVNSDIYAWIYIPGTEVDYPVLQHSTKDDYYLTHNLDGSVGKPGCIYTQLKNNKDFTDFVTVLYGHNIRNGNLFHTLHNYEDVEFFNKYRYIFVYTPDTVLVYQIFSAVAFNAGNILLEYNMDDEVDRTVYINDLASCRGMNDHQATDAYVVSSSRIITLSTCIEGKADSRWLVNGVLLNDFE